MTTTTSTTTHSETPSLRSQLRAMATEDILLEEHRLGQALALVRTRQVAFKRELRRRAGDRRHAGPDPDP